MPGWNISAAAHMTDFEIFKCHKTSPLFNVMPRVDPIQNLEKEIILNRDNYLKHQPPDYANQTHAGAFVTNPHFDVLRSAG